MRNNLQLPSALPEDFAYTRTAGLNDDEVRMRTDAGESNAMRDDDGKTVGEIVRGNLFNFFNLLNIVLGICLLLTGSYRNMLFLLVVIGNTLIGTVQELRARKTIRELQLLNAPRVHLIRNGKEIECSSDEAVRGDLAVFRSGDQVIADAMVISGNGCAMESLLTGESDAVPKRADTWLYSGSYITEGKMTAQLVYMADESYAGRLTREAKKTARPKSALMNDLNRLIRIDSMILIPLGILLFLKQFLIRKIPLTQAVPSSVAAMLGMIPEGLILLTSVAMAVGVIRLGQKHTLVQELCGIETLARVDVLCLDKTGTLTSGDIRLERTETIDAEDVEFRREISRFLGAFDDDSNTLKALRREIAPSGEIPQYVLPFSSERKKSAAAFGDGTLLVMGAPEFVLKERYPDDLREHVNSLAAEGKRVTVFASGKGIPADGDIPPLERILGICIFSDEIRNGVEKTIRYFSDEGVELKVISGDSPRTVSMIAGQAGMKGWNHWIDATELKDEEDILDACEKYTVFGRVTPAQKKMLVQALQKHGHSVAMTGDGVNDIPALKAADCSIAIAGGADAAKHAAQLTLLDSDFSVMPEIVLEGRRVVNNITRAASLFLTKTLFSFFLSVLLLFLPGAYPFQPIQMTLVSSLTVGIPGFFLALEPSRERIRGHFLRTVILRALPGGLAVALCATMAMLLEHRGWNNEICSTLATLIAGTVGFVVLMRTCMPINRMRIVILVLVGAAFAGAVAVFGKTFFLTPVTGKGWAVYGILAALGCIIIFVTAAIVRRSGKE